jgi:precorrin-2 dehydrogenase/sirohydrochlorin ferrochelatase
MRYYPVFLNLKGKKCIVIGGGEVAERKVLSLLQAQAEVTVISPSLTEGLGFLKLHNRITHIAREYREGDLEGAFLVIAATSDEEANSRVFNEAEKRGIPVNVVDSPGLCRFIVPSVIRKGSLTIAISTSGVSPAMARTLRQEIENFLPETIEEFLLFIEETRKEVMRNIKDPQKRRETLELIGSPDCINILREKGLEEAKRFIEDILRRRIENWKNTLS